MKLIHLLKNESGAVWVYKMVAIRVAQSDHEIHIVIPHDGPNAEKYKELGCEVHF